MTNKLKPSNWLIFVDTNIFLDFYRLGGESAKRQIDLLEKHKDRMILSEQIHMEFLRNRQRVLLESINKLDQPKIPQYPPIVTDSRISNALTADIKKAQEHYKSLKHKIENILNNPSAYDPVYQALNRFLENDSVYNLKRPNKTRFEIRNLARKRFALGYPPRKQNDTSIGDAINWEWIIRCAVDSKDNCSVLIVTRDTDYGVTYGNEAYINDWLSKEFKDRVSRKSKVILTNRLTKALKMLSESVEEEDIISEDRIINEKRPKKDDSFKLLLRAIFGNNPPSITPISYKIEDESGDGDPIDPTISDETERTTDDE